MKIPTHPDNLELICQLTKPTRDDFGGSGLPLHGIEIITNSCMPRDNPTGRYVLPDGRAVPPNEVVVPWGRFAEWTPVDLPYLLRRGIVREEREPLIYMLEDKTLFDMLTAPMFSPLLISPY